MYDSVKTEDCVLFSGQDYMGRNTKNYPECLAFYAGMNTGQVIPVSRGAINPFLGAWLWPSMSTDTLETGITCPSDGYRLMQNGSQKRVVISYNKKESTSVRSVSVCMPVSRAFSRLDGDCRAPMDGFMASLETGIQTLTRINYR